MANPVDDRKGLNHEVNEQYATAARMVDKAVSVVHNDPATATAYALTALAIYFRIEMEHPLFQMDADGHMTRVRSF